jgi:hypothetical protein
MDQIHWICPGTWYTLFQLLVWNIWLMQTWGFCSQPFTSRFWLIFSGHHDSWWLSWLCWFLFLVMNWMNCACSCFTLTWWFANVVDWHGSRVCVLFIWPLLHPWPWHTSSFTLWLTPCLPCCCLPSNSLAMVKLEPSVTAQVWSAWSYPVLSRFWTSTSVQWQCSLSKLNFCDVFHSVQTEFLTLNILSSTCDLFCRFWSWVWPEDVLQAFSLGFSLGKSCNFPFSFLFIIIHQFLYQKYCKDYVFCVDDQ